MVNWDRFWRSSNFGVMGKHTSIFLLAVILLTLLGLILMFYSFASLKDGYWECTGTLSRFLGLDVDFFANVFLKEKGIGSLGAKAHAVILKLVATMLVLQLIRVMKMADGELLQSLFRLTDRPEPRPAHWDAVKKAVQWVCWADRQYPCVYSRLEFGLNWESCTRQLLGLDSLPPCSPLIPVLQRSTCLPVM